MVVGTIYNKKLVHINSITNANMGITVTTDRCEPNCDSDGGMCIQLPCSSNGNLEYLLSSCSPTKANGLAVNGGTGSNEVCEVANVAWVYKETLCLCIAMLQKEGISLMMQNYRLK